MSVLIKNGRVITAADDSIADIYIEGETIVAIGKNLDYKANQVIDASGKMIFPGGIDPHVHLSMPFMGTFSSDTYETGTRAALYGGTTMVIDFVLQTQGDSLKNALTDWQSRATGTAVGDYSFHMAVTDYNENVKAEIKQMVEEEGITSFKTFMAYVADGQMATWNKLQTFDLELKYAYDLNKRWDFGAAYLFEFIHMSQPRNLLSFRNSLNVSATYKF